jgi:hypothetical protein
MTDTGNTIRPGRAKIQCYLRLDSQIVTPEHITHTVGLLPTASYRKGEAKHRRAGTHTEHSWQISTGYQWSDDLNTQMQELYHIVLPAVERLKELLQGQPIEATFESVIYIYGDATPAIFLEHNIVTLAAELGATFDFDTYVFEEDDTF